jgi:phosphoglucosamine mutase
VIVDEKGRMVDGDQIMALIAESWHRNGKLAAGGVVATVMSNLGLERYLGGLGLKLERTPVGDRYVVDYMRKHGHNVGGEQSGHIVLGDYTTTGDGLVAALQVLAVVMGTGQPVSEVCKRFEAVPQLMQNVRYANGSPLENARVKSAIDAGRAQLGESGRLLVRPSGTEPLIRVMAEGDDAGLVRQVVGDIAEAVRSVAQAAE